MVRKFFTNGDKIKMVLAADTRQLAGESLKSIARDFGVQPVQIRRWRKNKMKLANTKHSKKTLSHSRRSEITHLEEQIIGYGLDLCARGLEISYITLQVRACQIDEQFRQKNKTEQYQQIRRLAIPIVGLVQSLQDCVPVVGTLELKPHARLLAA